MLRAGEAGPEPPSGPALAVPLMTLGQSRLFSERPCGHWSAGLLAHSPLTQPVSIEVCPVQAPCSKHWVIAAARHGHLGLLGEERNSGADVPSLAILGGLGGVCGTRERKVAVKMGGAVMFAGM